MKIKIPALGGLKQENHEFKASLSYIARPCLKKTNKLNTASNCIFLSLKYLSVEGWGCCLVAERVAYQAQSPGFNPQHHKNKQISKVHNL
jgi:hypothetical protein